MVSADELSLPDEFWQGLAQFNRGDYYDCHDTLEALWIEAPAVDKPFYQGILQISVGFYHLRNCNWRGAAILLGEGSSRLCPFEPNYGQVDVADLVDQSTDWLTALQQTGPERVAEIAQQLDPGSPSGNQSIASLSVPNISRAAG
ncbi:MAG: DUF309 domain-containing protein [Cyanobacteria bacterium J06626_23]